MICFVISNIVGLNAKVLAWFRPAFLILSFLIDIVFIFLSHEVTCFLFP